MPHLPDYEKLRSLGYRVFGPIISPALYGIIKEAESDPDAPLLFIGREGYFLRGLADDMRSEMRLASRKRYSYLDASRSFLFKLLMDQDYADITLTQPYRGNFVSFFADRFFLDPDEVAMFGGNFGYTSVELPRDKAFVKEIIRTKVQGISEVLKAKRDRYIVYLREMGEGLPYHLVDVGFSGSIQKCLGALTGQDTRGYYFYKSKKFDDNLPAGKHSAKGFWINDATFGEKDPLVDFSLVLESLLTAPWGTLRDIRPFGAATDLFVYDDYVPNRSAFYALEAIISGVRKHAVDFVRSGITFEEWSDLVDVRKIYDLALRFDMSEEMSFVRAMSEIDDSISGYGKLKPFNFLPGL